MADEKNRDTEETEEVSVAEKAIEPEENVEIGDIGESDADPGEAERVEESVEEPDEPAESETEPHEDMHPDEEEDHEDHHEDGRSLSGRILTGLIIFIAGAVFILWLGPRIAPSLPSGMAPVANWLAPGGSQADAEIDALRAELEARIASLDTDTDMEAVNAAIAAAVASAEARLKAEIAAIDTSDPEMAGTIALIESQITGLRGEIDAWESRFQGMTIAGGQISEATATEISTYGTAIAGLRREIEQLAARQGELSARLDVISSAAEERVQAAEQARNQARIEAAVNAIEIALDAGLPFEGELSELIEEGVEDISAILEAAARDGVATMDGLRRSFGTFAHDAIRADLRDEAGDGVFARAGSFLRSQVATRSLEPIEGDTVDAILSRAEAALRGDDLVRALAELQGLSETGAAAMAGWIALAEERLGALNALAGMQTALTGGE